MRNLVTPEQAFRLVRANFPVTQVKNGDLFYYTNDLTVVVESTYPDGSIDVYVPNEGRTFHALGAAINRLIAPTFTYLEVMQELPYGYLTDGDALWLVPEHMTVPELV